MRSMIKLTLALSGAGFLYTQACAAETLRCGWALIQPGDDAEYVLEQCGDPGPASDEATSNGAISVYPMGITRLDRWRYHRGPGLFPAVVIIAADGRVADIQFDTTRD
jgi:Protein of unknown function (DUF2845)